MKLTTLHLLDRTLTVVWLELFFCQGNSWLPDLVALNYNEPLPAPSPAVQATLVSIAGSEIHDLVQTTDNAALLDKDEDGEHAPLLLSTLDLSHWTAIMLVSTQDNGPEKAMARIREAHDVLANLLEKDEIDLEEATSNTSAVEAALRTANPHEDWSDRPNPSKPGDPVTTMHPLLGGLNIPHAQKAALEDLGECIQSTQIEQELASQDALGKGPAIPFLPPRAVEVRLNTRSHRTWCLNNINLLAPIPTSVWKIWANLSEADIKTCEDRALSSATQAAEGVAIANAFPLALFDNHKCTTTAIKLHAKQDVLTCPPRHAQYTSKLWNCRRPYLRCTCSQNAKNGCKGNMIWFDHSVWFILNNLDRFFDARYPSLAAKFGAFITWISAAALMAVKMHITFMAYRRLMDTAALELAANPSDKLLSKFGNAPGARQVERLIKSAAFSLETTPSPSPASNSKRRKLNMNVTPDEGYFQPQRNSYGPRGRGPAQRPQNGTGGRGRYNKNFRPAHQPAPRYSPSPSSSSMQSPAPSSRIHTFLESTPPSVSTSSVTIRPWSPIKGRVLAWDDL